MNSLPKVIEGRPWVSLMVIVAVCFYPAIQMHVAEWKDSVDASATTVFQPELVIDAWWNSARTLALALYAYMTRSGTAGKEGGDEAGS